VDLSIERTASRSAIQRGAIHVPWIALALIAAAVLWLPMLVAGPSHLTSDESLYLAESHNIARGQGFTYPSGEPITHRAPLYPLALAPAVARGGDDAAYALAKAMIVANALLVMVLAWRVGGALAGTVAGFAASASAYLSGLGTTLYLDPMQCAFMLGAVLALLEATRTRRARWFAIAGVCTGVAFLVKESAVEWIPLAAVAWLALPSLRNSAGARGALVFTLAFGVAVAPWLIWAYAETSTLFLIGAPDAGVAALILAAAAAYAGFAGALARWPSMPPTLRNRAPRLALPAAAALTIAWGAFMLFGLTRYSSWSYPNDYLSSVPRYLRTVAPQAQPYFLLVAAWCVVTWRAVRGDDVSRLLAVAALLFAPFALFTANRGLQLRDALPIVYLSYVALGVATAVVMANLRERIDAPFGEVLLYGGLAVAGVALAVHQTASFLAERSETSSAAVRADNWDSPFVRQISDWMSAHLPEGSHVLSSRLYFSSVHVNTDGRFRIRQMPTVRVDPEAGQDGLLVPRSNLFRWGDHALRPSLPSDNWLHLRRFPGKEYWVGLRQQELLEYITEHEIDYILLTGEDIAFSSLQYADYFSGHPAFTLLHRIRVSAADQFFVYAVDRDALFVKEHSMAISPSDAADLERETGMSLQEIAVALGSPVRVTDYERGLSAREERAVIAGIDLGMR